MPQIETTCTRLTDADAALALDLANRARHAEQVLASIHQDAKRLSAREPLLYRETRCQAGDASFRAALLAGLLMERLGLVEEDGEAPF